MKDERWMTLFLGLNVAAWAAEFWILWDPDLQGVQDAIGWWMAAIFFGFPMLTGIPFAILYEEPGAPGDGGGSGTPARTRRAAAASATAAGAEERAGRRAAAAGRPPPGGRPGAPGQDSLPP